MLLEAKAYYVINKQFQARLLPRLALVSLTLVRIYAVFTFLNHARDTLGKICVNYSIVKASFCSFWLAFSA